MSNFTTITPEKQKDILITFLLTQLQIVANSSTIGLKKYCPDSFQRITLAICYHLLDNPDQFLFIFKPDTIKEWWKQLNATPEKTEIKSKVGRPPIPKHIKEFVFLFKLANSSYGYKRISGELLACFRLKISPSSVRNILRDITFNPYFHNKPFWKNFLKDKAKEIIAVDFIKFFRPKQNQYYFLLFFIQYYSRDILHFNTTEHPTKEWIENQLRWINDGSSKKYLIRDNDMLFKYVDFQKFDLEDVTIPFKSPNINAIAERLIRSYKEETAIESEDELSLDKIHFSFSEFKKYYNLYRPHQGIGNITIPQFKSGLPPVNIDVKDLFWLGILTKVKMQTFYNGKLKHYYIE